MMRNMIVAHFFFFGILNIFDMASYTHNYFYQLSGLEKR